MEREAPDEAVEEAARTRAPVDEVRAMSATPTLHARLRTLGGWSALVVALTAVATVVPRIWIPPSSNPTYAVVSSIVSSLPMLLVAWLTWTRATIAERIRRATDAHPAGVCPRCLHAVDPAMVDELCSECGALPGSDRIEGPRPRDEWRRPRVDLALFGLWGLLALTLVLLSMIGRYQWWMAASLVEGLTRAASLLLAVRLVPGAWGDFKRNVDGRRRVRRAIAEAARRRAKQSSQR
jgi:hypothetical protein